MINYYYSVFVHSIFIYSASSLFNLRVGHYAISVTHREKESILVTYKGHSLPAASSGDACLASPQLISLQLRACA